MKTVRIPSSLHEVLGTESTLAEILLVFTVGIGASLAIFSATRSEWSILAGWKTFILFLLIVDTLAGFMANLTLSTNNFYRDRAKARLIFIAIHVQPIVFSLLFNDYFFICFMVWAFTITSALIVNTLQKYPAQKPFAGALIVIGLVGLLLNSVGIPLLLIVSLIFYQFKVIYSFAVDQYAPREI